MPSVVSLPRVSPPVVVLEDVSVPEEEVLPELAVDVVVPEPVVAELPVVVLPPVVATSPLELSSLLPLSLLSLSSSSSSSVAVDAEVAAPEDVQPTTPSHRPSRGAPLEPAAFLRKPPARRRKGNGIEGIAFIGHLRFDSVIYAAEDEWRPSDVSVTRALTVPTIPLPPAGSDGRC